MFVSIIIPVYNVETYISECVTSVLRQEYRNFEVILVDDGSTDQSGVLCDEFANLDSRVKVIHKTNSGAAGSRNTGIFAAAGEYVIFLDGDDVWDDSKALAQLVERIKFTKADVLNFSYIKWFENTSKKVPYFYNVSTMPSFNSLYDQLEYLTSKGLYIASPCNKFIRRKLLEAIPFDCGVSSEDIQWCAKLLINAKSMDFVCLNFYLYRQRMNSTRYTIDDEKCEDLTNNIINCIKLLDSVEEEKKVHLLRYVAFQIGTFFIVQAQTKNLQTDCINRLKDYSWILKYNCNNVKLRSLYCVCKWLPFRWICRMIRFIYRSRES